MIFIKGTAIGFLLSSLPGPAGFSILEASEKGSKVLVRALTSFLGADLFVFLICALIYFPFAASINGLPLKELGGVFLVLYALYSFLKSDVTHVAAPARTFGLCFASPGVWLMNFGIVALSASNSWFEMLLYFLGIQLGSLLWFVILTAWFRKTSVLRQWIFKKASLSLMMLLGFGSLISTF